MTTNSFMFLIKFGACKCGAKRVATCCMAYVWCSVECPMHSKISKGAIRWLNMLGPNELNELNGLVLILVAGLD